MTLLKVKKHTLFNNRNIKEFVKKLSLETEFADIFGMHINDWTSESYAEDADKFDTFVQKIRKTYVIVWNNELQKLIVIEIE